MFLLGNNVDITNLALRRSDELYLASGVYLKHMASYWLSDLYNVYIIYMNINFENGKYLITPKNKPSFYLTEEETVIMDSIQLLIDKLDI